jgi:hypothetical protein
MGNSKHPYLTKEEFLKVTHEIDIIRLWNSEAPKMTSSALESFGLGVFLLTGVSIQYLSTPRWEPFNKTGENHCLLWSHELRVMLLARKQNLVGKLFGIKKPHRNATSGLSYAIGEPVVSYLGIITMMRGNS